MKSKFYKEVFKDTTEIPEELQNRLNFGFVIKYADDVVTGWCISFSFVTYTGNDTDSVGIKLVDAILDLGNGLYHHSYINIIGVPVVFFPKEL